MADEPITIQTPVYAASENRMLSLAELLDFFQKHGSRRVSDLHLKVKSPPTYRIDGSLQPMKGLPMVPDAIAKIIDCVLSPVEKQRLDRDRSVDSSYITTTHQFRLNVFHDNDGPAMAIRALDETPPSVEEIGFPNNIWYEIIGRTHGLVLVTGITGAGKSTTIASLIERIASLRPCRIITLEDPVEYRLKGKAALISQREVGRDVPSFERGLRDCLREDPDVIFVGEMRDRESARWTLTAAETGHLVFSTLHTRDVRGTITRILDMFPANQQDEIASQLSLGLACILCQKLVPRADGSGRVVAMEVLNNGYAVSNLIRTAKVEQVYSQLQTRTKDMPGERMITLEAALANLVHEGLVDAAEAERWANHPATFQSLVRHHLRGR